MYKFTKKQDQTICHIKAMYELMEGYEKPSTEEVIDLALELFEKEVIGLYRTETRKVGK